MKQMDFTGLTGYVVTPLNPEYELARQEWNRAINKYPIAIDYCRSETDTANAVMWCRRRNIGFRIRSGGHNYAGYSTGNRILVIDISRMNNICVDEQANTITAQCGAANTMVYSAAARYGYPFPGGTCPTVRVSGLVTGGGIGLSCRKFGLACDNVIEMEIVDYKGSILKCNSKQNSDLFWALRGAGGGNFGIVTSITFKLPDKVDMICLIRFDNKVPSSIKADFFDRWQRWLINLDSRISMFSSIYNEGINGKAFFYGSPEECWKIIKPLIGFPGFSVSIDYVPFIDAVKKVASEYPSSQTFQSSGRFVYRILGFEEIQKLISIINNPPEGSVYTAVSLYSLGGNIAITDRNDTAFFYRNSRYILAIQTVWEDKRYDEINKAWFEQHFKYVESLTRGSYVNFPYSGLKTFEEAYWGGHAGALKKIKRKYDPFNVFRFPQSIRTI